LTGHLAGLETWDLAETFKILGWEEVQVQAGKYRAIKLEYKQKKHPRETLCLAWKAGFGTGIHRM
jgi:hypothetical protein